MRTWKNSSRFDEQIATNFKRSSGGMPVSWARANTRRLKSSQLSSRLSSRSDIVGRSVAFGYPEVPLQRDPLPLGVAHDALAVAPELGIVAGQEHQPGHHPRPELLEHGAVAVVAVQLPMRRHRAKVHDAHVSSRWLVHYLSHLSSSANSAAGVYRPGCLAIAGRHWYKTPLEREPNRIARRL